MHVGYSALIQNLGRVRPDAVIYREELRLVGVQGIMGSFYGGMPHEEAEPNLRTNGEIVMPAVKRIGPVSAPIGFRKTSVSA